MHANIDIVSANWFKEIFLVAQTVGNLPAVWANWAQSLGGEDALKEMQPTPVFCLQNPRDRGARWFQRVRHDQATNTFSSFPEQISK